MAAVGTAAFTATNPVIDRADETAAASILIWVAAAALPVDLLPDHARMAWLNHPWIVTATAVAVTLGATTRWSA